MELNEISKKVKAEALAAGISEKRLDTDIVSANLPEKGKFVGYEIANPNQPTAHIRMIADDGSKIPLGNLKSLAYFGSRETAKFRKIDNPESPINGGWVLTGTQAINPNLGGKMPEVVAFLLNKEFKAEPLELLTLSVKSDNGKIVPFATEKSAKDNLVTKRFFKVTLL